MADYACTKCSSLGTSYLRSYKPEEFIEGDPRSPIWIIGLNPAMSTDWRDGRSTVELRDGFAALVATNGYFRKFRNVAGWLFVQLGQPMGVAHTDLIKCASSTWPPSGVPAENAGKIASICSAYLRDQLLMYRPRVFICNGTAVCHFILSLIPPPALGACTSYAARLGDHEIIVVLSRFVGRIDNYARRRLGREIEEHAKRLGLATG
jgi:uracil-DNA glycosylase